MQNTLKHLVCEARNDTARVVVLDICPHHGICLARARLAIRENCAIVALQHIIHRSLDAVVKYMRLARIHGKYMIKGEHGIRATRQSHRLRVMMLNNHRIIT